MELYAFPYAKIQQNSKIIIYGAGKVGQTYLHQVCLTKYCHVVCMVDKDYQHYSSLPVKVYPPEIEIMFLEEYSDTNEEIEPWPMVGCSVVGGIRGGRLMSCRLVRAHYPDCRPSAGHSSLCLLYVPCVPIT